MHNLQHILIIRFSSIGDIVLTTPIVRALKKKYPSATIHFLTKKNRLSTASNFYATTLGTNILPQCSQTITFLCVLSPSAIAID